MSNIKKFQEFVKDKKINSKVEENLEIKDEKITDDNYPYVHLFIAEDIKKGFTDGTVNDKEGKEIDWDLEVNVKDWVKLDDEDIDMIADQIAEGKTEGNDPIDWKLAFGGDSFEEEEEEFSRQDIANQLDIDKDEFEDSSSLGDMADKFNDEQTTYDYAKHEAEMLFDAFKESNDVSKYFTKSIGSEFEYNKEIAIFKSVINYYDTFKNEEGYLDEFNTPAFDLALKQIIKEFLGSYVSEKKSTEKKSDKKDDVTKYKDKIRKKLLSDEEFLPNLDVKNSNKFNDKLADCKSKEEVDELIKKFSKIKKFQGFTEDGGDVIYK